MSKIDKIIGFEKLTHANRQKYKKFAVGNWVKRVLNYCPSRYFNEKEFNRILKNIDRVTAYVNTSEREYQITLGLSEVLDEEIFRNYNDQSKFERSFPRKIEYCKPLVTQIEVPSGTLIFGNDFRSRCAGLEETKQMSDMNINDISGDYAYRKAWADRGVLCAFLGNTCPRIYRKNNEIIIANLDVDDKINTLEDYEVKGYICTDVWHFMAMDKKNYKSQGGRICKDDVLIKVEPGTYVMTAYYRIMRDYDNESQLLVKINKID